MSSIDHLLNTEVIIYSGQPYLLCGILRINGDVFTVDDLTVKETVGFWDKCIVSVNKNEIYLTTYKSN